MNELALELHTKHFHHGQLARVQWTPIKAAFSAGQVEAGAHFEAARKEDGLAEIFECIPSGTVGAAV